MARAIAVGIGGSAGVGVPSPQIVDVATIERGREVWLLSRRWGINARRFKFWPEVAVAGKRRKQRKGKKVGDLSASAREGARLCSCRVLIVASVGARSSAGGEGSPLLERAGCWAGLSR